MSTRNQLSKTLPSRCCGKPEGFLYSRSTFWRPFKPRLLSSDIIIGVNVYFFL